MEVGALSLHSVRVHPASPPASRPVRTHRAPLLSSAQPDERDEAAKKEDDALAAAFAARLDAEGGATQFKIKTTLTSAADELKEGVSSVASTTKSVADGAADGLMSASGWQLVVGLLAATVLFSVVNAGLRSGPVDVGTTDGTTLEFGQRSEQREIPYSAYQPQLGLGQ